MSQCDRGPELLSSSFNSKCKHMVTVHWQCSTANRIEQEKIQTGPRAKQRYCRLLAGCHKACAAPQLLVVQLALVQCQCSAACTASGSTTGLHFRSLRQSRRLAAQVGNACSQPRGVHAVTFRSCCMFLPGYHGRVVLMHASCCATDCAHTVEIVRLSTQSSLLLSATGIANALQWLLSTSVWATAPSASFNVKPVYES